MRRLLQVTAELERFLPWRATVSPSSVPQQRFEEWVFLNASGVLLGEKTGELLALRLAEFPFTEVELESALARLAVSWGFAFRLLHRSNGHQKLIIYDLERLRATLEEAPYCVMSAQLNYRYPLSPKSFLDEIVERWEQHGAVPHEIGVALGYPLEDVFGYMGLLPLACKGVCGWRVYGCMAESRRRSANFQNARCRALAFLAATAPERQIAS